MQAKPRVFISYARSDGKAFAIKLRKRLQKSHPEITLWQDVIREQGGRDWWLQITEAIDHVEFMVLVMTPAAMKSETVRKEWRYARQKGVCVYPVKGVPDAQLDFNSLPRWMRDKQFYDLELQWDRFINDLNTRCQTPRVPFMVDDLPPGFVRRPNEFEALIAHLRDEKREEPIAITAALRGAGGYGKTTLARAMCHDEHIQEAFDDGILWVTLGENPGELRVKVLDLIEVLSGERPGFETPEAAGTRLAELLVDRDILMVIDDVWAAADLGPFLRGGPRCGRLVTTRILDTLPLSAKKVNVDAMRQHEAVQLLAAGLPPGEAERLRRLASRLGEWPLLLRLANGALRHRVEDAQQPIKDALAFVEEDLEENGLTAFDASDPKQREQAVASTLGVSLKALKEDQPRYQELAIFPEDVDIPLTTAEKLWGATGGLSRVKTEKLCERLARLSLLLRFDLTTRTIRLHDVMRAYLARQLENPPALHARLIEAWGDPHRLPDAYAWKWIAYHLLQAQRKQELRRLLLDFDWMQAKLEATDITALTADYDDVVPGDPDLQLVQAALRLSAHVLAQDKTQLAAQLLGRLSFSESLQIQAMLDRAARWKARPWLRPLAHSLTPPGGPLLRALVGHTNIANAVAVTPDGTQAISASDDRTLKVWDLQTGKEVRTLQGHTGGIMAVAVTPDGAQAISASDDRTLKVWHLQSGKELRTLQGHTGGIMAVAVTPDGAQAISASDDRTLKVWHLQSGKELRTLQGHTRGVTAVAVTPDGVA